MMCLELSGLESLRFGLQALGGLLDGGKVLVAEDHLSLLDGGELPVVRTKVCVFRTSWRRRQVCDRAGGSVEDKGR